MMESSLAARTYTDQHWVARYSNGSTASQVHTVKDLYDALCREIPSSRDRERFLSRCKAGI